MWKIVSPETTFSGGEHHTNRTRTDKTRMEDCRLRIVSLVWLGTKEIMKEIVI
jgi:hypothetical protein